MASPFDLYQGKTFEGLDPNRFNKEAYMEQQRQLFADTFKDQLGKLGQSYQQQTSSAKENQAKLNQSSKQLQDLNSKTKGLESNFKSAESSFNSSKKSLDESKNLLTSRQNTLNSYKRSVDAWQRDINTQNSRANSIRAKHAAEVNARYKNYRGKDKQQRINNELNQRLAKDKSYNTAVNMAKNYTKDLQKAQSRYNEYKSVVNQAQNTVNQRQQSFNTANQQFQQANNQLNQHKQQVQQVSQQVNQFNSALGGANKEAEKAMQEASSIQKKIQDYQTRSEPLKDLESKIEGDYAAASKASIEELKKIASNNLDPVSQKNAQNLLNQRAEQLAKAFGKNVEDVKKEMGTGVGQLQGQQFANQEEFNKFMGIEAPKAAELQEEGDLRAAQAPGEQTPPPEQPKAEMPPATPAAQPQPSELPASQPPTPQVQQSASPAAAVPPQPPTPQPAPQAQQQAGQTQQIQQASQAQTTGAPKPPAPQPAPQQPQTPAQPQAQAQQSGMPKPPTPQPVQQQPLGGPLNNQIRQGFQRQIQQGFQNAMKIKATPQSKPQAPQQADPMADRRRAVASQALGIASKPTSVSKPIGTGSAFDKGQNVTLNQQQSSVNKGVGRRPVR